MHRTTIALLATSLWLGLAAGAETYYVRNRPFAQVVKNGSEPLVQVEAFLKALDLGWSQDGQVLQLNSQPSAGPALKLSGPITVRFGDQEVVLEPAQRGELAYLPLRPLARLCSYSVSPNPSLGTVDINKARFATDEEKSMNSKVTLARGDEEKARQEAWSKRAAELKARREAKSKEGSSEENKDSQSQGGDPKDKPAEAKEKPPEATAASEAPPAAKEAPKEAKLEVFRADTAPDPNGVVTMTCEVKNMGEAPSKPTSGMLILKGPDRNVSASNNVNTSAKVWTQKTISIPAIQPGAGYQFTEKYRHPSGNSMPIGNITAEFKLNSTK